MAMPWTSAIKRKKQLVVYTGSSLGSWAGILKDAIRDFNSLSRKHQLGVTFAESSKPSTESGVADVSVEAVNGTVTHTYDGEQMSVSLNGRIMHGLTRLLSREGKIEKALIFLPRQPQVLTPTKGVQWLNVNSYLLTAIHELVHACGLTNNEHSSNDLFQANPQVDSGDTAAGDKVTIQTGGKVTGMPPFVLSGPTVNHIRLLWT